MINSESYMMFSNCYIDLFVGWFLEYFDYRKDLSHELDLYFVQNKKEHYSEIIKKVKVYACFFSFKNSKKNTKILNVLLKI